jgi:hypothetical protein
MTTATLKWTVPTTRTDDSPLNPGDILSIDVFDGTTQIGSVSGAGNSFVTGVLSVGSHSFTVVVNDTAGHKSAPSNIATVTVPATLASPSAVDDLSATLNDD